MSAWEWFPERKGLLTGIILAAHGSGSALHVPLSTYLMNPKNM
jgi:hypothetical protein